jgi:bifunctional DNA-binding transcriptional regulator/antitoxin component of YhaV-PrlF toxin-antitoxin module
MAGAMMPTEATDGDIPFFAEVTAGGRITIPEEIRKIFEIKDGDAVFCRIKIIRTQMIDKQSVEYKLPAKVEREAIGTAARNNKP